MSFLIVTSLANALKLKCVCVLYVSYSKCMENTFSMEEYVALANSKQMGGTEIVPSEFLERHLLRYGAYAE
jgi:hypothetical protein